MTRSSILIVLIISLFSVSANTKLPSYVTPCSRVDPNLNDCVIKNGNAVIPYLIKGDRKYKIPVLAPLKLDLILIDPNPDFHMELRNIYLYGFENTKIVRADVDPTIPSFKLDLSIPLVTIISDYKTEGRILFVPLGGDGPSNITIVGGIYKYEVELNTVTKNNFEHFEVKKSDADYIPEKIYFQFDNLFSRNERLGANLNQFLNENWPAISDEFRPTIRTTIQKIADSIISGIAAKIASSELFAP